MDKPQQNYNRSKSITTQVYKLPQINPRPSLHITQPSPSPSNSNSKSNSFLNPKQVSKSAHQQFNLRTNHNPLPQYNPLTDKHLKIHYQNQEKRKQIMKSIFNNKQAKCFTDRAGKQRAGSVKKRELGRDQFLSYMQEVRDKILKNKEGLI